MHDRLISLAEPRVHARPANEDEARAALEWLAAREGKTFSQLLAELETHSAI